MAKDLKFLATNLRVRVAAALLAQQRSMDARADAGLEKSGQLIWTRAEVNELLAENRADWMALMPLISRPGLADWDALLPLIARQSPANQRTIIRIIGTDPTLPDSAAFAKLAKLQVVANARLDEIRRAKQKIIDSPTKKGK
jgi:hypothetical protein